jgi:hypothetical protein
MPKLEAPSWLVDATKLPIETKDDSASPSLPTSSTLSRLEEPFIALIRINNVEARFLIDTGVSGDFISSHFTYANRLKPKDCGIIRYYRGAVYIRTRRIERPRRQSGQSIIKDLLDYIDEIMVRNTHLQIEITWIPGHSEIQRKRTSGRGGQEGSSGPDLKSNAQAQAIKFSQNK